MGDDTIGYTVAEAMAETQDCEKPHASPFRKRDEEGRSLIIHCRVANQRNHLLNRTEQ